MDVILPEHYSVQFNTFLLIYSGYNLCLNLRLMHDTTVIAGYIEWLSISSQTLVIIDEESEYLTRLCSALNVRGGNALERRFPKHAIVDLYTRPQASMISV